MDAQILRYSLILISTFVSTGATYQTPNFVVTAPTQEAAKQVGQAAESYRKDLAIFWLDQPLPKWSRPCKLRVKVGSMGAGGETKFQFSGGHVSNWSMYVQGSMERILDSVLPHEVNHTIFACHYRRPLPRWADEGAATLFEHRSEQVKQLGLLNQVITSDREFISLRNLLTMKEYPKGYRPMLILYAEGYALVDFLLQQGGRKRYLKFLRDGERMGWPEAIKANYHHGGVESLQQNWQSWVLAGMPRLNVPADQLLAENTNVSRVGYTRPVILEQYMRSLTVRSQSPDAPAGRVQPKSGKAVRAIAPDQRRASSGRPSKVIAANHKRKLPRPGHSGIDASGQQPLFFDKSNKRSRAPRVATVSYRDASFEAPRPRTSVRNADPQDSRNSSPRRRQKTTSSADRFRQIQPASNSAPAGLERTKLSQFFDPETSSSQRKHLPQERKVLTGSIPQWAGFPGQKELF